MKFVLRILRLKRVWIPLSVVICALAVITMANWYGLHEGIVYLWDGWGYHPAPNQPVQKDGPFGLAHRLASLTSLERMSAIKQILSQNGVHYEGIPVARGYDNIFVPGDLSKGFLLVEAHYDKAIDSPDFQAATDNTGSVVILLEAIRIIRQELPNLSVAFLFTALEEQELAGAFHFIEDAHQRNYIIKGALCLDMLGRGSPIIATSAEAAGFRFHVPFFGSFLYDGQTVARGPKTWPINRVMRDTYLPKTRVYRAFVSCTDATAFLQQGIPALHLEGANMWHAEQVWGRSTDTLERLDERDLSECLQLIMQVIKKR